MTKPLSVISSSEETTVVTDYVSVVRDRTQYESEEQLEENLIFMLKEQGYEYLKINSEEDLIFNLRKQIEKLNSYKFSDNDWEKFVSEVLCNKQDGIREKTRKIQKDKKFDFLDDKGELHNIKIIDSENIHKNFVQVINQYTQVGNRENRYDVTILVNGLPLVHIELKRRGVAIKEAFNQIERYQKDSFWSELGLFEYIQIFVISNGTNTKYYSNTTREGAVKEHTTSQGSRAKTSNSFEFTSYWSDANNKNIYDIVDFTRTFFAKHTLLNILTKYCVFTSEEMLLVMRPYQIVATERILNKILISTEYKKYGTIDGGGYVWHTTGSGKTLTSFKTAQLASRLDGIDKVLFVVDRRDLDYQTKKEYEKFEKGCADSSPNTTVLTRQLEDKDVNGSYHEYKIIITTIQKLSQFIKKNPTHSVYNKHIVMIFDECHRSQFGNMHALIVKKFSKYHLFGFTGTPIFPQNANGKFGTVKESEKPVFKTTEQIFGDRLHTYTIINAISDNNVLPFKVDYYDTMKLKTDGKPDKKVKGIDKKRGIGDDIRVANVVKYIFDNYSDKTKGTLTYNLSGKVVHGFNSIFATDSKAMAVKYYTALKAENEKRFPDINGQPNPNKLKIALIYTWMANEDDLDSFYTKGVDKSLNEISARDCLESAIMDYNLTFKTNYNTGAYFENYRDSISEKLKNRELDLLVVVDMFLTGFDATTLNTLWVDKYLELHGLIQAFSRTNRILNSIKNCGNIVCFRDLSKNTDEAIALFGDSDAKGIILLKKFSDYYEGYVEQERDVDGHPAVDNDGNPKMVHKEGYKDLIDRLKKEFPLEPVSFRSDSLSDKKKTDFIVLWGNILRMRNILSCFEEFKGKEILSEGEFQDYKSIYLDFYDEIKEKQKADKEVVNSEIVFEMDLLKSVDINIDYIEKLILTYHATNQEDKELLAKIMKSLSSSTQLRSKKMLIAEFIASLNGQIIKDQNELDKKLKSKIVELKEKDIVNLVKEENLKDKETREYIANCFKDNCYNTDATSIYGILNKSSFFSGANKEKSNRVAQKLNEFFDKYKDI